MTISTRFFIFVAALVVGFVGAAINIAVAAKRTFNDREVNFGSTAVFHILFAGLASLAGLGALITGIIWIVQTFKG